MLLFAIRCKNQMFDESHMPQAATIITVHNEWPSILLRTIYSIINRTPRKLLKEIIIVDDNSDLGKYTASFLLSFSYIFLFSFTNLP